MSRIQSWTDLSQFRPNPGFHPSRKAHPFPWKLSVLREHPSLHAVRPRSSPAPRIIRVWTWTTTPPVPRDSRPSFPATHPSLRPTSWPFHPAKPIPPSQLTNTATLWPVRTLSANLFPLPSPDQTDPCGSAFQIYLFHGFVRALALRRRRSSAARFTSQRISKLGFLFPGLFPPRYSLLPDRISISLHCYQSPREYDLLPPLCCR